MPPDLRGSSVDIINFIKSDEFVGIVGKIVKHETDHLNQTISELRNEIVMLRESNIQLIHMLTNQNNLVTSNRAPTKENTLKKKNVTFAETVKCNTKNADTINKQMKEKATLDTDRPEIVNENLNRESWNIVTTKSNKRIKKREVIRGSDTSSSIKGVVSYSHLHVYNLDPKTTANELNLYLKSKNIEGIECEVLQSKYPERYSSFKVSFPSKFYDEVNRAGFWPENTCINRFLFHLTKKREAGT